MKLLTAKEVAEALKVSTNAVYRWAREGKLACVVLAGRAVRFDEAAVAAFIAANKRQAVR